MADFHPSLINASLFLDDKAIWEVVSSMHYDVDNMTEEELRQSIIQDILQVTMWEKEFGLPLIFGYTMLVRFLPHWKHKRVYDAMKHEDIVNLIDTEKRGTSFRLRIHDRREILQAAMDYCGIWYTGFSPPEGTEMLCANHEKMEEVGGFDAMTASLSMELQANVPSSQTFN